MIYGQKNVIKGCSVYQYHQIWLCAAVYFGPLIVSYYLK